VTAADALVEEIVGKVLARIAPLLAPVERAEPATILIYATVAKFASLLGYSKRYVETLIARGLPVVGSGRARRIDVERARLWLAERSRGSK
jgi:hypothetical protein